MLRLLLAAAPVAGAIFGSMPNPHPHAIVDGADAIESFRVIWSVQYPTSGADNRVEWNRQFKAILQGDKWIIRQVSDKPDDPAGMTVEIDAKDGHIILARIIDQW